jgi:hypothetical protein
LTWMGTAWFMTALQEKNPYQVAEKTKRGYN